MSKEYLLAVDAGTGSIRAVLFDTSGNQICCIQKEWFHKEDPRFPKSMDFDWEYNWSLTSSCIRGVLEETKINPGDIAAISTTCMREGIVLYDSSGKEIWACANVDARSDDEVIELIKRFPSLEKELYKESGQSFALDAIPRLLWVKNKMPEVYSKTASMGMFNDWLIYRMTGILAIEPSNGSTSGLFNLKTRKWDTTIAERAGIRTDIFPPVLECGEKAGTVNEKCSQQTGLSIGTPVIVGGGDCQLGCIGVGVVKSNQAAVFGGSFWQYEYNSDKADTDELCRIRVNCAALPDLWQYEALAFQSGLVIRYFRDAFCQEEIALGKAENKDPYEILNEKAKDIPPGCYGLMCAFSDVMNFTHWKHAAPTFTNFGLDPIKYSKYTFYKGIMENTALITKGHLELVAQATGHRPSEIVFAGGGSKSPLWCQILADVLELPVKVPVVKEATALGAAILAGYGCGIYKDITEATEKIVKWDNIYMPDAESSKVYNEIYRKWRAMYDCQLGLAKDGITKSMWAAPGL